MKTAIQINMNNRVQTVIQFTLCGTTTTVKAGIDTKTAKAAIGRPCGTCTHIHNHLCGQGWWLEFGLSSNPYVYGPMPRLRTSRNYRMEEARRNGWMAWVWGDEYQEERKGYSDLSLLDPTPLAA
ncbi:hypothetical protein MITS9508_01132 [Synechococcus sp. MIT S9508]|nr:hypothetical protein MITS9508_01132 [Synechococcus sp. MIT S9508]